jgi:uncharacterized protein YoxC
MNEVSGTFSSGLSGIRSEMSTTQNDITQSSGAITSAMEEMKGLSITAVSQMCSDINSKSAEIKNSLDTVCQKNPEVSSSFRNAANDTSSAMNDMNNSVRSNSNSIVSAFQDIINKAKEAWNWVKKAWNNSAIGSAVNNAIGYVPAHANGGFPEDGLFFANHGEMVGKFSNGKTAVANNEQITNGIAEAVYGAFVRAFAETGGGNNDNGPRVAVFNLNGREFARATYEDRKAVDEEHGISLISY